MLLLNECYYLVRQPIIWMIFICVNFFTILMTKGLVFDSSNDIFHFQMTLMTVEMTILVLIVATAIPTVFLRDKNFGMHELIATTPTKNSKKTLSRILSIGFFSFFCLVFSYLSILYIYQWKTGITSIFFKYYFLHIFVSTLPNTLLLSSLGCLVANKTSNSFIVFLIFGAIWLGYLFLASITGNPSLAGSQIFNQTFYQWFIWLDPYGYTSFIEHLAKDKNISHITHGINRLLVICVSFLLYYLSISKSENSFFKKKQTYSKKNALSFYFPLLFIKVLNKIRYEKRLSTLISSKLLQVFFNKLTMFIFLIWTCILFFIVSSYDGTIEPFTEAHITSIDTLKQFVFQELPVLGTFLVLLWSWQIYSVEKRCEFSEVIASTPVHNYQLLLSQAITLMIMITLFIFSSMLGAISAHAVKTIPFDFLLYVTVLSYCALPLMIQGTIFLVIFHLCRHTKLALLIICIGLSFTFIPLKNFIGIPSSFINIGWHPLNSFNVFWELRANLSSYWHYTAAWFWSMCFAIFFAIIFSHRGSFYQWKSFHKNKMKSVLFILLITTPLYYLHVQSFKEKPLNNVKSLNIFRANYEQQWAQWREKPQPSIEHLDATIDFHPQLFKAEIVLTYRLRNHHQTAIDKILVGSTKFYDWTDIHIENAALAQFDKKTHQAVFILKSPLQPHESITMKTSFTYKQPKLWTIQGHQVISPEFSYLRSSPLIPVIGYQPHYEIIDQSLRKTFNLRTQKATKPSVIFADVNKRFGSYKRFTLTSIITTDMGYHALSQGQLLSKETRNNRKQFIYQTQTPIRDLPSWLTFPFSGKSKQFQGVELNVFVPHSNSLLKPIIENAVKIHMQAMEDTLQWFSEQGLPYRGKQLSIVASPLDNFSGYALPQIVLINFDRGFRAYPSQHAEFDQRYRRAVHETVHQWFGHDIGNGVPQDRAFLIESLTKCMELILLEKHYGKAAVTALVNYEQERYQRIERFNFNKKLALIDATSAHDQYSRASIAFQQLREVVGDKPIIAAIRELWSNYSYPNQPANAMDFIRCLKKHTPSQYHLLIHSIFLEKP